MQILQLSSKDQQTQDIERKSIFSCYGNNFQLLRKSKESVDEIGVDTVEMLAVPHSDPRPVQSLQKIVFVSIIPEESIPYHIIPGHTIPYHTITDHTIREHTISYHTWSYHIIPYESIPGQNKTSCRSPSPFARSPAGPRTCCPAPVHHRCIAMLPFSKKHLFFVKESLTFAKTGAPSFASSIALRKPPQNLINHGA